MPQESENKNPTLLIIGKLPPPYYGPAVATQILLHSGLNRYFSLLHLRTNINDRIEDLESLRLAKVFKSFALYIHLIKLLWRNNPALVLVPISQSTIGFFKDSFFILLSKWHGKKVIVHLRGSNFLNWVKNSSFLNRFWVHFVLKRSDGVIVLGQKLRYLFADYYPSDRIFVVPNGADYKIRTKNRKLGDKVNLLYLSNLQSFKGIEDFLNAIVLLREFKEKFKVDVVGDWWDNNTRVHCEQIVASHKLPVKFNKAKAEKEKFIIMLNSDIFIFPPRMPEGHPWVILEAMASGLPIISTDQGAITESVIDGVNGFIVEKQNPQQIAAKIKHLIDHPEIRLKMGQESRRLYLEKFTEDKMVERLANTFHGVLNC